MRRVLITGSAGFLGRHLCAAVRASGAEPRGLDLAEGTPEGVETLRGSLDDDALLARALDGVDAVIHAAALADLWRADPAEFDAVNHQGARRLFRGALAAGVRRVAHISSYTTLIAGGRGDPGAPLDETVEHPPGALLGPYPAAKRRAELAAVAAAREGLGVSILLPTAPIGPGDTRPTPPGALLRDLAAGRLPALLDSVINLVDVRQVADAAMTALDRGAPGRRYLLAGEDVTLHDLARRVAKLCGARAPRFTAPAAAALLAAHAEQLYARLSKRPPTAPLTGVRIAMRRRRFSAARARAELDFAPGTIDAALADALREIAPLCEPAQAKG